METQRQIKIGTLLQKEFSAFFNRSARESTPLSMLISVTKVRVAADLSVAKVYLSIFPSENAEDVLQDINKSKPVIKHHIALKVKHQLRKVPEFSYYVDDSLDYIEGIEEALTDGDNPIQTPDLLDRRKKV